MGSIAGVLLVSSAVAVTAATTSAQSSAVVDVRIVTGPAGSQRFGEQVLVLGNGNYITDDPGFDVGDQADVGAVHLYDGDTDRLISTLTGSMVGDRVGSGGFLEVGNSNVIVISPNVANSDGVGAAGAVTWINGETGFSGVVNESNSLVGNVPFNFFFTSATLLANGNYVVTAAEAVLQPELAITWGDGNSGVSGRISSANSIFNTGGTFVSTTALDNGNYVVTHNSASRGVIFWGDGAVGGHVSSTRLSGGPTGAVVPFPEHITELTNGDVVVATPDWDGGRGAVTVIDGSAGLDGSISAANSLVGNRTGDRAGSGGVYALSNGNLVIHSPTAQNADESRFAALTLIDGAMPPTGALTLQDSAYDAETADLGYRSVVPLTNGNFVFTDPGWDITDPDDEILVEDVGIVRVFSGELASPNRPTGLITSSGSLTGTSFRDQVGSRGVVALSDGDFAVLSAEWNDPVGEIQQAGAVTWQSGSGPVEDTVSPDNSLVGSSKQDRVGSNGLVPLGGGAAVVMSPQWRIDDDRLSSGAVTWVSGSDPTTGPVSTANSLYGTSANDRVGSGFAIELSDANFVTMSPLWGGGRGATTRGSGTAGIVGPVGSSNSHVGASTAANVGSGSVQPLVGTTGRYVVWSPDLGQGAVTLGTPGNHDGVVSVDNSAVLRGDLAFLDEKTKISASGAVVIPTNDNRLVLLRDIADAPVVAPTTTAPASTTPPITAPPTTEPPFVAPTTTTTIVVGEPDVPEPIAEGLDVVSVEPGRLLDTRSSGETIDSESQGEGRVGADDVVRFVVAGRGGVDDDAIAAELNLTAIRPRTAGFATLYPCTEDVPTASALNFVDGVTIANSIMVPLTEDGEVCLTGSALSNYAVDVVAYVPAGSAVVPQTPARFLDTRAAGSTFDAAEQRGGRTSAGGVATVTISERNGIPAAEAVDGVLINLTAVRPDNGGFATVFPCTDEVPNASSLNFSRGQTVANAAMVPISEAGTICVFTSRSTDLLLDVAGYVGSGSTVETFEPDRLLDTRTSSNARTVDELALGDGRLGAGDSIEVWIAGRGGVPVGADTALLNLTVAGAATNGFATLHPCGDAVPNASTLNFLAGANAANATLVKLSATGTVCVFSSGEANFLIDAAGSLSIGV